MKILQLCNKPPYPPRDGGSLAMFSLASALSKLGHQITVLTMFTDKHRLTVGEHQEYARMMQVHTLYVDATVSWQGMLRNLIFSGRPYTASRFDSFRYKEELIKLLKSERYDIIQLEGLYLTLYIDDIRRFSDAKIVLRAHNVEHEIWERIVKEGDQLYKKIYFRIVAKRLRKFEYNALNRYDLLVPITQRDLDKFNSMGNVKPAHVSSAGIDISTKQQFLQPENPALNFSLFFLGSLDWIPNQEGLLWFVSEVFPFLRKQHPDLRLHVAGRNAPTKLIRTIARPGIIYHGQIEDPDKFSGEHTVMVAPCFSGSGMRLKIIEAMALGKPVVTTTIGAEGLSAERNEHILIENDAESFRNCIENLMNNPEFCEKIGQQAYQFVYDHYNNADIAGALADFYQQHLK